MRFILNLLFLNMSLVHIFKIPYLKGIVGVILHILRVLHLSQKRGGIPHIGRQISKVLRSERVSVEKFLDDLSKSKKK